MGIRITNDIEDFVENNEGRILIYGAGNTGYWVGMYMNRCGIDFECFLDGNVIENGTFFCEKPVYKIGKLQAYRGEKVRIILALAEYEKILPDLSDYSTEYELDMLCLVARYKEQVLQKTKQWTYNINRLLGWFRRKLINTEIPTIISSDCTAGRMYECLGMTFQLAFLTPTINTQISPDDFIKICKNPEKYFKSELDSLSFARRVGGRKDERDVPVGRKENVYIYFTHGKEGLDGIGKRWNNVQRYINWNRMIYILTDQSMLIPWRVLKEFSNLQAEKLLLTYRTGIGYQNNRVNSVHWERNYFFKIDEAIENHFDLLGWINKEYE